VNEVSRAQTGARKRAPRVPEKSGRASASVSAKASVAARVRTRSCRHRTRLGAIAARVASLVRKSAM
jgi:hypothetical protein